MKINYTCSYVYMYFSRIQIIIFAMVTCTYVSVSSSTHIRATLPPKPIVYLAILSTEIPKLTRGIEVT